MPLDIAVVQTASSLEPMENRDRLPRLLEGARDAGLVVLPEAFARDFGTPGSDVAPFAEPLDGPFVEALVRAAGGRTVVAGMFERSDDPERPFNTLVVVDGQGLKTAYRKIHLYDSFGYRESLRLSAGPLDQQPVLEVDGVRLGLATCYDLRFPELTRRLGPDTDLLVVPAAWVAGPTKVHHWRTLLAARAIENVQYVVGAGQPAPRYTGHSLVIDPLGLPVAEAGDGEDVVLARIDPDVVAEARRENPSLANRRL